MDSHYQKMGARLGASGRDSSPTNGRRDRLDYQVLCNTAGCQVVLTRWSPDAHPSAAEGCLDYAAVEFMRTGTYLKHTDGRAVMGDPNSIIFFRPGERFRISHPTGESNSGITVRIGAPMLGAFSEFLTTESGHGRHRLSDGRALNTGRLHYALTAIVADLTKGIGDDLEFAERALLVAEQALQLLAHKRTHPSRSGSRGEVSRAKLICSIIEFMNVNHASKLSLEQIGAAAGVSGWHAARLMREELGVSLHRYLRRLRLRYALAQLAEGCQDLTQLALRTGFSSHSHLTSSFHREYKETPRAVRRRLGVAEIASK